MWRQLLGLLDGVDGDVPRTGDRDLLALQGLALGGEHGLREQHRAVPGGLGTHQRTAPGQALSGEHPGVVGVAQALVLPEHVADLTAAHADVAGGDVGARADVTGELGHERLAEAHDLGVGPAVRVEVGPALAAADA